MKWTIEYALFGVVFLTINSKEQPNADHVRSTAEWLKMDYKISGIV